MRIIFFSFIFTSLLCSCSFCAEIPSHFHEMLGMTDGVPYRVRLERVHALGNDLSRNEIEALYWFLHKKDGDDPLPLKYVNPLKNDITNALMEQRIKIPDLSRELIGMFFDQEMDNTWRDYCIQFLGVRYRETSSESERKEMLKAFEEGLQETYNTIPGTSLIALANLEGHPDISREYIIEKAIALANRTDGGNAGRITAFQICAKFGCREILPMIRNIASSPGDASLRMSAIAAIGMLGDESDLPLLEKLRKSSDIRIRTAALRNPIIYGHRSKNKWTVFRRLWTAIPKINGQNPVFFWNGVHK